MDYSNIIKLIGEIIGAVIAGAVIYIMPKAKAWLTEKIGESKANAVADLIYTFVEAAEQQFAANDPDGIIRKNYVNERLIELGYTITNEINAQIESAVYELNEVKK